MNWCRDVDYGNLPQWLALGLALIFGSITARGVWIAAASYRHSRETFAEDVRLREYAQARLVYGEIAETRRFKKDVSSSVTTKTEHPELVQFEKDGEAPVALGVRNRGTMFLSANMDSQVFVVRVHNNSEELISKVNVGMRDHEGEIGGPIGGNLLGPRTTVEWVVAVAQDRSFNPKLVTVTFFDAMGKGWVRRGGEPVQPFPSEPKPPPSRFRDPAESMKRSRRR